jgi:hypothetical protein
MIVEITFKSGDVWDVKPLYISEYTQFVETEEAYYIIPCKDILIGRVSPEEFQIAQKEAKGGAALGESDIGVAWCLKEAEVATPKPKTTWKSVPERKSKAEPKWAEVTAP